MTLDCWLDWADWALPIRLYVVNLNRFRLINVGLQIGPLMMVLAWY